MSHRKTCGIKFHWMWIVGYVLRFCFLRPAPAFTFRLLLNKKQFSLCPAKTNSKYFWVSWGRVSELLCRAEWRVNIIESALFWLRAVSAEQWKTKVNGNDCRVRRHRCQSWNRLRWSPSLSTRIPVETSTTSVDCRFPFAIHSGWFSARNHQVDCMEITIMGWKQPLHVHNMPFDWHFINIFASAPVCVCVRVASVYLSAEILPCARAQTDWC